MNDNPLVSIILPTYNRANIISMSIDAVIAQTYINWEIIVIDNHSTDSTSEVIANYSSDKRIKYMVNPQTIPYPKSVNVALKSVSGDLCFISKDDLYMHPTCLEILVDTYLVLVHQGKNPIVVPRYIEKSISVSLIQSQCEAAKRNVPYYINKYTGRTSHNLCVPHDEIVQIPLGAGCNLYPTDILHAVHGFEENAFIGNYYFVDFDLDKRITRQGYQFFFQSKAIVEHNHPDFGGLNLDDNQKAEYYYIINYITYLRRSFGLKSLYMIPLFILTGNYKSSLKRFFNVKMK
jgi:glycosyltransferase involved in cell wall biosynthesis